MNLIDILHLKYLIVTGLGKTNKSLHLCRNEAHLAAQLVPPIHIVQMEGRCPHHTIYTPHHRRAARLVGSLYPAGLSGSQEYNCYAHFFHACATVFSLPTGTFLSLPASHYWRRGDRASQLS